MLQVVLGSSSLVSSSPQSATRIVRVLYSTLHQIASLKLHHAHCIASPDPDIPQPRATIPINLKHLHHHRAIRSYALGVKSSPEVFSASLLHHHRLPPPPSPRPSGCFLKPGPWGW